MKRFLIKLIKILKVPFGARSDGREIFVSFTQEESE